MADECWLMRIAGRVQGVGYRASARHEAQRLGLKGQARNLADGSVELIASGEQQDLATLQTWCRRGPTFAIVESVEVQHLATAPDFTGFDIV